MADEVIDAPAPAAAAPAGTPAPAAAAAPAATEKPATVATGADDPVVKEPTDWPQDWREKLAGKDEKALKQLKRYDSVSGLFKKNQNLEKMISERTLPRKPDADATPEEVAEWRGKVGLAESPEKLMEAVKLPDGRMIGDDDKPIVESFVKAMWEDSSPQQVSKALGWYYEQLEDQMAARLEADETFQVESRKALKEEWGPGEFKRNINQIGTLFTDAPEGLFDRIMTARDAEGRVLGDNPEFIKFLTARAFELNPQATIIGGQGGGSVADRLSQIRAMQTSSDHKVRDQYWSPAIQAEELQLIAAEQKMQSRTQRAA